MHGDASASPIRVAVCGARGRMGQEMIVGLGHDPEIAIIGGCDPRPDDGTALPDSPPIAPTLAALLDSVQADVAVDFTTAEAAIDNARTALDRGVPIVIGTTGLTKTHLEEIDSAARAARVAAFVAPNFAIGAILMIQFARIASRFFDSAEIIEIHHDAKIDAPSGTALLAAEAMRAARSAPFAGDHVEKYVVEGARGGVHDDVHIHSLRMPGFVASHEVIFGGPGQSLRIRHDSIGRDSFVPGVAYAVKHIRGREGLVYGLDQLIDLGIG